jgi:hypothetical protein
MWLARELDPTKLVMNWSHLSGATALADVGTLYEPVDPSEQLHLQMAGEEWRDSRGNPGIAQVGNSWNVRLFAPANYSQGNVAVYGMPRSKDVLPLNDWANTAVDLLVAGRLDGLVSEYLALGGKVVLLLAATDSLLHSKALVHTQFMPRWLLTNGRDVSCTLIAKHPAGGFSSRGIL